VGRSWVRVKARVFNHPNNTCYRSYLPWGIYYTGNGKGVSGRVLPEIFGGFTGEFWGDSPFESLFLAHYVCPGRVFIGGNPGVRARPQRELGGHPGK